MKHLRQYIRRVLLKENTDITPGHLDKIATLIMSGKLEFVKQGCMLAEVYGLIEPDWSTGNKIEGIINFGLNYIHQDLFLVDVTILDPDLGNLIWSMRHGRNVTKIQEPATFGPYMPKQLKFPLRMIFGYLDR